MTDIEALNEPSVWLFITFSLPPDSSELKRNSTNKQIEQQNFEIVIPKRKEFKITFCIPRYELFWLLWCLSYKWTLRTIFGCV